ncbi:MAG TPA: hypothetical protein PLN21_09930 [Gemmatales bacterium]|nr:hypothetical protein [Gemmatales bacterium]
MLINRERIRDALEELSDCETQKRLWLSDGSNGAEVSSFTEAVESLFSDSGLSDTYTLDSNGSGLGNEIDNLLLMLHYELKQIDTDREVKEVIADPQMGVVRSLAKQIHSLMTK